MTAVSRTLQLVGIVVVVYVAAVAGLTGVWWWRSRR